MINEPPYSSREIEQIKDRLFGEERQKLDYLLDYVSSHQDRIGTDPQLQSSVAKVIAGALHEAGVSNHSELSTAIAPLIINVIRQEIRNSKSEIAHTLYPQMGKLISSYLSSNLHHFLQGTNQTIERAVSPKYFWLSLKSLFTGQPYEKLLLEAARIIKIRDVMLINKENGFLIEHWQSAAREKVSRYDPSMISSMLMAINSFSQEAFDGDHQELRTLDFGRSCIYMRSTPLLMVAVSCTGYANIQLEKLFDVELQRFLEKSAYRYPEPPSQYGEQSPVKILPELVEGLSNIVQGEERSFKRKRAGRYPIFSVVFLSLFFISISSWATTKYIQEKTRLWMHENIDSTINGQSAFQGFPVEVDIDREQKTIKLSGLSPSPEQTEVLVREIREKYPEMRVVPYLLPVFSESRFRQIVGSIKEDISDENSTSVISKPARDNRVKKLKATSKQPSDQPDKKKIKTGNKKVERKPALKKNDALPQKKNVSPVNVPAILNNLPSIQVDDTPDFNDPEIQKEMEKANKFVVPKRLQKRSLLRNLKGDDHPSSGSNAGGNRGNNGNSGGNGNSGNSGNSVGSPGNSGSNSNRSNAPGQLKKN